MQMTLISFSALFTRPPPFLSPRQVDTLSDESVPLLRLRCPYGRHGESTGDWSRDSKLWENSVSSSERERLASDQLLDGEFYLSFTDFVQTFTAIECVHLDAETSRDEPTLQGKGLGVSVSTLKNSS